MEYERGGSDMAVSFLGCNPSLLPFQNSRNNTRDDWHPGSVLSPYSKRYRHSWVAILRFHHSRRAETIPEMIPQKDPSKEESGRRTRALFPSQTFSGMGGPTGESCLVFEVNYSNQRNTWSVADFRDSKRELQCAKVRATRLFVSH